MHFVNHFFLEKSKRHFGLFIEEFFQYLRVKSNVAERKKSIISSLLWSTSQNTDNKFMTMGKLSKLIQWFGPLKGSSDMIETMESICSHNWFFGAFSAEMAEGSLRGRCPWTFLVRLNTATYLPIIAAPFTISVLNEDFKPIHIRVYTSKKGGYYIEVEKKQTRFLGDLNNFIGNLQNKNFLCNYICEGWPFQNIFVNTSPKGVSYDVGSEEEI